MPHDNSGMVVHNQNELADLPDRLLHEHLEPMLDQNNEDWLTRGGPGSQFRVQGLDLAVLKFFRRTPQQARGFIELPQKIKNMKCVINPMNRADNKRCFWYATATHYLDAFGNDKNAAHPEHIRERVKRELPYFETLFQGITFKEGVNMADLKMFENNSGKEVWVYKLTKDEIITPWKIGASMGKQDPIPNNEICGLPAGETACLLQQPWQGGCETSV